MLNGLAALLSVAAGAVTAIVLTKIVGDKKRAHAYWNEDSVCGYCHKKYDGANHYLATGG